MFEEFSAAIYDYFLIMDLAIILAILIVALLNRKKSTKRERMDFDLYRKDWKKIHMYQEQIDEEVRSGFNRWLKFNFLLGRSLAAVGFTPNLTSTVAFFLSTASAYCFIRAANAIPIDYFLSDLYVAFAVALLLLSGLLDVLDGAIARLTYSSSAFGDFLDNVLDKYSDAVVLIALVFGGLVQPLIGLAALVGSFLVDYARARTMGLGLKRTEVTIGERPFRMMIISGAASFQFVAQLSRALNILIPIGENAYLYEPFMSSIQWGILVLAILTHFSTIQIAIHAKKHLPKESPQPS